ncbi:MAG: exonuclease domain-containing protein [Candidatus Levybacteria bacterium]|nr:exonuclease domain-containing protein [Candidatus Levybacteria bacterium]
MNFHNLAILDVETTGAAAPYDRIIEIGVLRIENGNVVKKFETLLNPEVQISPFIENLTGISNSDLTNAPTFSEIKSDLVELLEGCVFVAHNARFDYSFIKNEFKRIGIPYSAKQLCTVKLSRLLFPHFSHHNLDSIIERFEINCERRHRAYDDAAVIWEFMQKIKNDVPSEKIEKALKTILKKPSLPPLLKKDQIEKLPQKAGVYLFFGSNELPLYIGKSINIKDRVLSHFINDTDSSTEMEISQQVERIETIETGGELSALILESELIKKMQPIYNRKLRYTKRLTYLKKKITKDGYFSVELCNTETFDMGEIDEVLGIFKSRKAALLHIANLVKEFSLCENLLGIQKTIKPCFSYRLGWCKGACSKKENLQVFNARFILAFSKTKLRVWPFSGPIVIKEKKDDVGEALIFDKWCYLGKYSEYVYEDRRDNTTLSDLDVYKILQTFLKDPRNSKKITTLKNLEEINQMQNLL